MFQFKGSAGKDKWASKTKTQEVTNYMKYALFIYESLYLNQWTIMNFWMNTF